ncbi:multidrug efflux pump subunit AcrB [Candidatus Termititenax persephonae]|uniref:Multidrug efflux pump subunit AcrB n=1 Tax=Candidatus Termititenax persephonae TaxID=2218525 RepID=A0A388TGR6_9BACT|nr:multidrug efflux pump subunit AcrB [Candidatus Termititenax persephonae]
MKKFVEFFLHYKSLVVLAFIGIVFSGWGAYTSMSREAFPQVELPYIVVYTLYPGVAPVDMENLISRPLENQIKGVNGIKHLQSTSAESYSMIFAEFNPEVDVETALQKVRDKVASARNDLPADAEEPQVMEISFDNVPILVMSLSGDYGLNRLKQIADDFKMEFESVNGVSNVTVIGGYTREIQVVVNPARLKAYNFSYDQFSAAVKAANINIPGGALDIGSRSYLVRIPNEFTSVEDIRNTVLGTFNNETIRLKDVADVRDTNKKQTSLSRTDRIDSVTLTVQKRSGGNIIEIANNVKKIVARTQPTLPKGTLIEYVSDFSQQIDSQVDNMENTLLLSLLLVVVVLYFFMGFRNATIVATVIPLSMLITFIVIQAMGFTLNFVVLVSLTILLGMLVDNAVVVVENIYRLLNAGRDRWTASVEGAAEVLVPVLTSTLTTVFAFLPLAFWSGMIGEVLRYLPITISVGLLSSFAVAIIFNPVISQTFLRSHTKADEHNHPSLPQRVDNWLENFKDKYYEPWLHWAIDNYRKVIGISAVAFLVSMFLLVRMPKEFFPSTDPEEFMINIKMPSGTRLETTDELVRKIETILLAPDNLRDLDRFVSNVGNTGAGFSGGNDDATVARLSVKFKERRLLSAPPLRIVDRIRQQATRFPGAEIIVSAESNGPQAGDPISIVVAGEDFAVLESLGDEIRSIMHRIPGVVNIKTNISLGRPEVQVLIDRTKASLYGFSPAQIAMEVRTAFYGATAAKYREGDDEYDIVVKLDDTERFSLQTLRNLTLLSRSGEHVPLAKLAEIKMSAGLESVQREDYSRVLKVTAATETGVLPFVALQSIQREVADLPMPEGYAVRYTGENEEMMQSFSFLGTALRTALLLVLIVLVAQFNSFYVPIIILITVALSLIGMVFGLKVTNQAFGMLAFIGLISLAGIVVNNGIVLLDFVQLQQRQDSDDITDEQRKQTLIEACKIRLRPVLLTSITTALGLLPLLFGIGINFKKLRIDFSDPGAMMFRPMASVIFFGLMISTVLTLIVVPVVYYIWDDWLRRRRERKQIIKEFGAGDPNIPL